MTIDQLTALIRQRLFYNGENKIALMAPSLVAHSCEPNCAVTFFKPDSSVVFIKSKHDVSEGEELTISLVDVELPYSQRQALLKERYGIDCQCSRCVQESSLDKEWGQQYSNLTAMVTDDETPFIRQLDAFIKDVDR